MDEKSLSVFGTRPEAIKMAPVVKELEKHPGRIESKVCFTTQHRQMLDQVLTLFGVVPRFDLDVMQDSQLPTQLAVTVMAKLEPVLQADVTLTEPLDYLLLVYLMKRTTLVLTDWDGIQEEAPGLGKSVLVLRDVTERPEAVEAGTVRVVGTDGTRIVEWTRRLLDDATEYDKMARAVHPYGDGKAAQRIVEAILNEERNW